jgi:hypothetical protein
LYRAGSQLEKAKKAPAGKIYPAQIKIQKFNSGGPYRFVGKIKPAIRKLENVL